MRSRVSSDLDVYCQGGFGILLKEEEAEQGQEGDKKSHFP